MYGDTTKTLDETASAAELGRNIHRLAGERGGSNALGRVFDDLYFYSQNTEDETGTAPTIGEFNTYLFGEISKAASAS